MVQGFVPDFFSHGAANVPHWNEGVPEKSFWTRTNARANQGIAIGAFRCNRCGFLEFYAREEFTAQ
jgi:hypothetical protein